MCYQKLINNGIKRLRLNSGLSQEQFAEKINLSVQGLRNLEQNRYQPTADTVDVICNTFKISPIDLLIPEPGTEKNELINIINLKLQNSSIDEIKKINDMIDIVNKKY